MSRLPGRARLRRQEIKTMNKFSHATLFATAALVATAAYAGDTTGSFSQTMNSARITPATSAEQEVSRLLKDVYSIGMQARMAAENMETYLRVPGHSWESHAQELQMVRDAVNTKGKTIMRLHELRGYALPWQQQAIDRIDMALRSLANTTGATIHTINRNKINLHVPEVRKQVKLLAERTAQFTELMETKLEYVDARDRLQQIEQSLN